MKVKKIPFNHLAVAIAQKLKENMIAAQEFTPDGKPKVDETVLEKLKYPKQNFERTFSY